PVPSASPRRRSRPTPRTPSPASAPATAPTRSRSAYASTCWTKRRTIWSVRCAAPGASGRARQGPIRPSRSTRPDERVAAPPARKGVARCAGRADHDGCERDATGAAQRLDPAAVAGQEHCLGPVDGADLAVDVVKVGADRRNREVHFAGDLLVDHAL